MRGGQEWLARLEGLADDRMREWLLDFDLDDPIASSGAVSWVAAVRRADRTRAVLKCTIPHPEARDEAAALAVWDGRGAVRLLDVLRDGSADEGYVTLLDRCVPGDQLLQLWAVLGEARALAVVGDVFRGLNRQPPFQSAFVTLSEQAKEWCCAPKLDEPALAKSIVEVVDWLVATVVPERLLHGDFHAENILAAGDSWVAIDPKPLVGDAAYEPSQWIGNVCRDAMRSADPVAAVVPVVRRFGELLGLDAARVAGWAFAKAVGTGNWDGRVAAALLAVFAVLRRA